MAAAARGVHLIVLPLSKSELTCLSASNQEGGDLLRMITSYLRDQMTDLPNVFIVPSCIRVKLYSY
ncbi:hypothetical protein OsJ_29761 [Oryza sativa Japonica Group]|uniref:Uncharacterized protein n=1 Tax=Oryza sativa subsp. japonica TaxID=39947 RepID=B9G465_ORYSJ|nr:hypothetical protein OsJ_29761 [Oryza sativa Japonica Group]